MTTTASFCLFVCFENDKEELLLTWELLNYKYGFEPQYLCAHIKANLAMEKMVIEK